MAKKQFKNKKNQAKNGKKHPGSNKNKGKNAPNPNNQEDQQEVEDLLAWGNQRQNYYKDDQSQYSSLSEEQEQANNIYQKKYDELNLNDQHLYGIQDDDSQNKKDLQQDLESDQLQAEQDQGISEQYLVKQLQWALERAKLSNLYEQNSIITENYITLLRNYILAMISLKQLKIPYIQHHPILEMIAEIKNKANLLQKKLILKKEVTKKIDRNHNNVSDDLQQEDENYDEQGQEDFQQESNENSQKLSEIQNIEESPASEDYQAGYCKNASQKQKNEHKKGLQYYNQLKKQAQQQKKEKKLQKKQQFIDKTKSKPIFKQITQTQGRFASELILKNKGLIKKRKKIEGNSRVKLRKKYQKKVALRRAQTGHFIRQNPGRQYQGQSNIKYGKIAGVKLK